MPWLHDPRYRHVRDQLVETLYNKVYQFSKLKRVLFLCGGQDSSPRDELAAYLHETHRKNTLVFYADDVWQRIAKKNENSLEMENELADLSDMVVIVVESAGTCAELGAFSQSDDLRRKLLPIVDRKHKNSGSFLDTGPLRWIDNDSVFRPTIYTDLKNILECTPHLDQRLKAIRPKRKEWIPNLASSRKHLLFFLCDLVLIIGPAAIGHIEYYVSEAVDAVPRSTLEYLLELGCILQLISRYDHSSGPYYARFSYDAEAESFHRGKILSIEEERAKVLSAIQRIPEVRSLLKEMGSQ